MDMLKKSQSLKLLPIAALLIITPLLSTSLRSKYLYFIVNILIIAVGAEAGLLSFFLQSEENMKPPAAAASVVPQKPVIVSEVSPVEEKYSPDKENTVAQSDNGATSPDKPVKKPVKAVVKCSSEKGFVGVKVPKVKKSPSTPSIFFIGGDESSHAEELIKDNEGEEVGDLSGQELFQKAETFIGNFYKQLKMQREESWKKLHDLSQKAF
ncbi:hypothetical protein Pfo_022933 [Paulownia fortunei]|nr:hypothetical protein Pfo_022933 [Paulownia fortunei]